MNIEEIVKSEIEYEIILHPEHDGPEGFFDSGDDEDDEETCRKIREESEWNEWAWCTVEVKATFRELSASDFLGACSYKDEKDFKEGGYFEDMKAQAFDALMAKVEKVQIKSLEC